MQPPEYPQLPTPSGSYSYTSSLPLLVGRYELVGAVEEQPAAVREIARLIQRGWRRVGDVERPSRDRCRQATVLTRSPAGRRAARSLRPTVRCRTRPCGRCQCSPMPFGLHDAHDQASVRGVIQEHLLIRLPVRFVTVVIAGEAPSRHERQIPAVRRHARGHSADIPAGRDAGSKSCPPPSPPRLPPREPR